VSSYSILPRKRLAETNPLASSVEDGIALEAFLLSTAKPASPPPSIFDLSPNVRSCRRNMAEAFILQWTGITKVVSRFS
jgi:hypothetical protein